MKEQYVIMVVVGLLVAGLAFWGVTEYGNRQSVAFVTEIENKIESERQKLVSMTEIIGKNQVDEVTESLVRDCSLDNRLKFDNLLSRLESLNASELNEIQLLFDGCAGFFALQKSVMTSRMEREYQAYEDFVNLFVTHGGAKSKDAYKLGAWKELVELQKKRSQLATRLVAVQRNIILALQNGASTESEEIQPMLSKARNINEESFVVNQQAGELRSSLIAE